MEALQPTAEGQPAKRPTPPDFSKKSFAQMFATVPQQQPLEFPLSVHKGEVAIKISAAAIDKLATPFKHALVGKFSHGRPTLEETRKALSKLDFNGALDVGLIDYRHVLLRFHSEADFHRIWTRGIWQIGKYPMRVFKWSPSFQTSKETSIVPVWFQLPGLPCHLFDHGVLFSIMKAVGAPISVDAATLNLTRPSVARVNVEINLMRELPSRIWIEHGDDGEGFWQRIIPDNLPLYCSSCFRQGHSHEGCTMHENLVQKNWKPKAPAAVTPKPPMTAAAAVSRTLLLDNMATENTVVEERRRSALAATAPAAVSHKQPSTAAVSGSKMAQLDNNPVNWIAEETTTTLLENNFVTLTMEEMVGEERTCCFPVASSDSAAADPTKFVGEGEIVEMELAAALGGKQMGSMLRDQQGVSGNNKTCKMANHVVVSAPTFEDGNKMEKVRDHAVLSGEMVEAVRGAALSGNKVVSTNLEDGMSLVRCGKHLGSTELLVLSSPSNVLEGDLSLVSSGLEGNTFTKVSTQKIIDWDHIFQTISGNILNSRDGSHEKSSAHTHAPHPFLFDTLHSNHVNVCDDIILNEALINSEINSLESNVTPDCPLNADSSLTKVVSNEEELEIDQRTEFLNKLEKRQCALSYSLPRTESAPLLRIHWLDKESPEPEIPDIVAQGKSLYLDEGQGDNTMVKVQFQEQVTSQIIQAKTPVKTSRYNLRSLSKAEISEIQNSKKKKKKEARRNALEFNYSDSDTHIDVDETEMNMGFYGGGFDS